MAVVEAWNGKVEEQDLLIFFTEFVKKGLVFPIGSVFNIDEIQKEQTQLQFRCVIPEKTPIVLGGEINVNTLPHWTRDNMPHDRRVGHVLFAEGKWLEKYRSGLIVVRLRNPHTDGESI